MAEKTMADGKTSYRLSKAAPGARGIYYGEIAGH